MMVNAANAIRPNTDVMMPLDQPASDCSWLDQLTKPHAANSKPITARITPNTVKRTQHQGEVDAGEITFANRAFQQCRAIITEYLQESLCSNANADANFARR